MKEIMLEFLPKLLTFAEFIQLIPEGKRYELHDGVIFEMNPPLGKHEKIVGFLTRKLSTQLDKLNLPYFIPKQALVKSPGNKLGESAYSPDILILNDINLENELFWEKESTVTQSDSIPLVIEVISTNWRVDYYRKYSDYEEIGIREYWIIDYQPFGACKFVGETKKPTISIYSLVSGEYQLFQFQGDDQIVSSIFPELNLTANQIFNASF